MPSCVFIKPEPFDLAVKRMNFQYTVLAKRLGITRTYLTILRQGRKTDNHPSAPLRQRMLKVLKVKFDDIFEIVTIDKQKTENAITLASDRC